MNSSWSPEASEAPNNRGWLIISTLALVGLSRFINLGFLDLQSWDEALYTLRSQGILLFGNWLDQTPHAVGGLYSSVHPPLQVWLTAIVFRIAGISEASARIIPALAGAATLPVIYYIGKTIQSQSIGFIAALLFGLNPFVSFYARQGQFDSLMVFFLSASVLFILRTLQAASTRDSLLGGICVGCALMTKLFVGFGIPLSLVLFLALDRSATGSHNRRSFWILLATAGLVSLPWHVFMIIKHGGGNPLFFLTQSDMVQRALFGIEGNVKPLEIFYFINQLLVIFPTGVCFFVWSAAHKSRERHGPWFLILLWFLSFFVVFSLVRTKLAVYALPMLVPASLLAAQGLLQVRGASAKTSAVLLLTTLVSVCWASSQLMRTAVKDAVASFLRFELPHFDHALLTAGLLTLIMASTITVYFFLKRGWIPDVTRRLPSMLLIALALITSYGFLVLDRTQFRDGATDLARFIDKHRVRYVVVAGFDRNPQLTFYLRGADIGWREDMAMHRIIPPLDSTMFRSWLSQELAGESSSALLVLEKDKFIRYRTINPLDIVPFDYQLVFESRRYTAFVRTYPDYLAVLATPKHIRP